MPTKVCFKCNKKKPLEKFYRHKMMADGHLGKCKECTKIDVVSNRKVNIDYYRAYDRERGNRQSREDLADYRARFPKKYAATQSVAWAIKKKILHPKPCMVCGDKKVHGHHPDYSKQLDVMWLCAAHHQEWHAENGEGLNGV